MKGEFPELATSRLLLRAMCADDAEGYTELLVDPETSRFIVDTVVEPHQVLSRILRNRAAWSEARGVYWSITFDTVFIGFVALHAPTSPEPALSYALGRHWQRCGFMSEAVQAVVAYALVQPGVQSVLARTHLDNTASSGMLRRLGFLERGVEGDKGHQRRVFSKQR